MLRLASFSTFEHSLELFLLNPVPAYFAHARVRVCRFHACRRGEVRACEKVESNYSNQAHTRRKMEVQTQPNKLSASKSSVLQSIYGEIIAFCFFQTLC